MHQQLAALCIVNILRRKQSVHVDLSAERAFCESVRVSEALLGADLEKQARKVVAYPAVSGQIPGGAAP
jgi:hypothetical protein